MIDLIAGYMVAKKILDAFLEFIQYQRFMYFFQKFQNLIFFFIKSIIFFLEFKINQF